MVDAVDEHRRVVFGRCRLHHFFGARIDVRLAGVAGQEEACGFDHHVHTCVAPFQVGGVAFGGQAYLFAVDHEVFAVHSHGALEAAVHRVILQHVSQVVGLEQVVDRNDFDVFEFGFLRDGAKHHAADAAKSVDTDANGHE